VEVDGTSVDLMTLLAASPDALVVNAAGEPVAVLEIKCRCPFFRQRRGALYDLDLL
jgi:hypothetical protein